MDSYSREEQNNSLLSSLSAKSSQLKHITLNIYDNAQSSHSVLDSTTDTFSSMGTNLRGSMGRLGRMARQGDRVAVFKLAGGIIAVVVVAWVVLGFLWRIFFGR
jgi:blocked-early-in-transport protein 1